MSANLPVYVVEMRSAASVGVEPWTELSCWVTRDHAIRTLSVYASGEPHLYGPFGCRRLRVREVIS